MDLVTKAGYLFDRRDRWRAAGLLLAMIVGAGFESLSIALIFPLIALVADPEAAAGIPFGEWITPATVLGVFLLKVVYLAALFALQYRFIFARQVSLSRRLYSAYLLAPYTFHLNRNSSELLRNLNQEVHWIFTGVIVPASIVVIEILVATMILAVLLWIHPASALAVLGVLAVVGTVLYRAIRQKTGALGKSQQAHSAAMIRRVQEGIGGIKEIKVLGRESWFVNAYTQSARGYTGALRYLRTIAEMPRLTIEGLMVVAIVGVVAYVSWQGVDPSSALPMLGLVGMAAIRLMPSLNRIGVGLTSVRYYAPAIDAVYTDLHALEQSSAPEQPRRQSGTQLTFGDQIELRNVTYRYPDTEAPALTDVCIQIRKGQRVAFIGPSGAGKTTIVDVILGLLEPQQGQVLVDGMDIRAHLSDWQRRIGYIPQHVFLADDSIRRNVAFGLADEDIDDDDVRAAIASAQLTELLESLPEGLETQVGERGVRLSGGQRQRIGIARALYHDPEVLVLDEATSALDNETEQAIADAVEDLALEKTILIIAHRLTTVQQCDGLFFLRAGQVAAMESSYEALFSANEDFRAMVRAGSGRATTTEVIG